MVPDILGFAEDDARSDEEKYMSMLPPKSPYLDLIIPEQAYTYRTPFHFGYKIEPHEYAKIGYSRIPSLTSPWSIAYVRHTFRIGYHMHFENCREGDIGKPENRTDAPFGVLVLWGTDAELSVRPSVEQVRRLSNLFGREPQWYWNSIVGSLIFVESAE